MGAVTKFDISNRHPTTINKWDDGSGREYSEGITALVKAFKCSTSIVELNVAGLVGKHSSAGPKVAAHIADAIKDMGALLSLRIGENVLRVEGTEILAAALKGNQAMTELDISANRITSDGESFGHMAGVIALTNTIKDMGALPVLSLKANMLATKEAGKVLAGLLKGNSVLKELDLSSNASFYGEDGPGFAQELAVGTKDNGALVNLDIRSNCIPCEQEGGLMRICAAGGIELGI
jgi:Ran GTPase-activating protein (RanGAP) involved in mRNA processing and transport